MKHFELPKKSEKDVAGKIDEATGLLLLIKPLLKRAGKLTTLEQSMMLESASHAKELLDEVQRVFWDAELVHRETEESAKKTAAMVRSNGSL